MLVRYHCGFIDGCPSGYKSKTGDIPGWGESLASYPRTSRAQCAQACSELPKCMSFEHSTKELKCNLNTEVEPTAPKYNDYVFCAKSGKV